MSRIPGPGDWMGQLPASDLEEVRRLPSDGPGFLTLTRREVVLTYEDGTRSQPFRYDQVNRTALDAVVFCAYYLQQGQYFVYLRSAVRPPLGFREPASWRAGPQPARLWELPAGLVESAEPGGWGVRLAAARELEEELGFQVAPAAFEVLGSPVLPAPALIAEQQFFLKVRVDPALRGTPSLDGSPLERDGKVMVVPLHQAVEACRHGWLADAKTELGVRRLAESVAEP